MITKIELSNFQRHKKLKIDLGQITTIVGPSDSGKSAIIRALRWSMLNRPSGSVFTRHGAEQCVVALNTESGRVVRSRGKSKNTYTLDDQEFTAFGADVPTPIAEALGVVADNFQGQHDAPYWLGLSPGKLSKSLNEVVDLSVMDATIASLAKSLRKVKLSIEIVTERLDEARADVAKYKPYVEMDRQYKKIEKAEKDALRWEVDTDNLRLEVHKARQAADTVSLLRDDLDAMRADLEAISAVEADIAKREKYAADLKDAVNEVRRAQKNVDAAKNQTDQIHDELAEFRICPICGSDL